MGQRIFIYCACAFLGVSVYRVEEQAQNLAYCLSLVTPTEKGLLQFQENFCCYQDHLLDSLVLKFLLNYINKAKKTGKNEVKVSIMVYEKHLGLSSMCTFQG